MYLYVIREIFYLFSWCIRGIKRHFIQKESNSVDTVWVTEMETALRKKLNNPYAVANEIKNNNYSKNQHAWLIQRYAELNK